MDPEQAKLVFFSIMAAGAVVWFLSLVMAFRLGGPATSPDRLAFAESPPSDSETGELTVRGEPASLSKALVTSLRQTKLRLFETLFRVTERSADRLAVEKTGPLICNQPPGLYFSEAEFQFAPAGKDTRVSYQIGYARVTRLFKKIALSIILGVGLPIMLLVGMLIWFLVVQNQNPAIRWQVFQTLQIAHALWPPFLFMWMYAHGRRRSKVFVENLIASAEALD